ncbi:hypothetical protein O5D80_007039 [Batrachochytrium dendrobatidis]|nr:hypothetical protein O5D80_007039 [Batrachochytrium dendrobatidis]
MNVSTDEIAAEITDEIAAEIYLSHPLRPHGNIRSILSLTTLHTQNVLIHVHDSALVACTYNKTTGLTPILSTPVFGRILSACILRSASRSILSKPTLSRRIIHGSTSADSCRKNPNLSLITKNRIRNSLNDLILCTSDSGFLSGIALCHSFTGYSFECIFQHKIAPPGTSYTQLGHIVVSDPLASCIAVAAFHNRITVFPINSFSEDKGVPLFYSQQDIVLPKPNSNILHMAFLNMPPEFPHIINLVVVVLVNREVEILLYEWNQLNGVISNFTQFVPYATGKEAVPLHLVSLPNLPTYFLIITESELLLLSSIDMKHFSRTPRRQHIPGPFHSKEIRQDLEAIVSSVQVLESNTSDYEHLYITSDQGHIMYLRIARAQLTIHVVHVGEKRRPISLMKSLPSSDNEHSLILFGSFCNGEIIHINAKSLCILGNEPISNDWNAGPTLDFCLADTLGNNTDTLYMTAGAAPLGYIQEIRHGVGVLIDDTTKQFDGAIKLWGLRTSCEDTVDSLLVASFVASTRIMYMQDDEFEDISDISGFTIDVATLNTAACFVSGYFIQVHLHGIIIARPLLDKTINNNTCTVANWSPPNDHKVGFSAFYQDCVLLTLTGENSLMLLKVIIQENSNVQIESISSISLDIEPSCIFCTKSESLFSSAFISGICIIGSYDSSCVILSILQNAGKLDILSKFSITQYYSTPINVPHSICIIKSKEISSRSNALISKPHLLIGIRDGALLDFTLDFENDQISFMPPVILQLGDCPLDLVYSHHTDPLDRYVLGVTNQTWQLSVSPIGGIRISQLLHKPILHAARFLYDADVDTGFLFLTSDTLSFVKVDPESGYHIRNINMGDTPRRILVDPVTKLLVVAGSSQGDADEILTTVKVMNPDTGQVYATERLAANETIHSLIVWHVKPTKRYICVGTRIHATSGRVLVFGLKPATKNKHVKFTLMGQYTLNGPVLALCTFVNSYLLASAGSTLYQLKIEAVHRTITAGASIDINSIITRIHALKTQIFIANTQDSISVYKFDIATKAFAFIKSDVTSRVGSECFPLDDSLVIGTDRHGNIYGLDTNQGEDFDTHESTDSQSMQTGFEFHILDIVLQLKPGSMKHRLQQITSATAAEHTSFTDDRMISELDTLDKGWWSNNGTALSKPMQKLYHVSTAENVSISNEVIEQRVHGGQVIYGATLSGGLIAMLRLRSDVYIALEILQNVLAEFEQTRPLLGNDFKTFRSGSGELKKCIDGQFVSQFLLLSDEMAQEVMHQWTCKRQKHPYVLNQSGVMAMSMNTTKMSHILKWLEYMCI